MLKPIAKFDPKHEDLVLSLSYDFYGTRLATSSIDHRVKVFDFDSNNRSWKVNESWKAHEAPIPKVQWSHPEYGQVLATCSIDRSVKIFEETYSSDNNLMSSNIVGMKRWIEKAKLIDAISPVIDIKFSPSHLGLKLATLCSGGVMRLYECMDPMNLSTWTLMEEHSLNVDPLGPLCHLSLSWCHTKFLPGQLIVSHLNQCTIFRNDPTSNKLIPKETLPDELDNSPWYNVTWAPSMGRSYELIATSNLSGIIKLWKLTESENNSWNITKLHQFIEHKNTKVNGLEFNVTGTILATSGEDGKVVLYKAGLGEDWKCMSTVSNDQNQSQFEFNEN